MKNTCKMLIAGAMAAIMSMSMFGCDDKTEKKTETESETVETADIFNWLGQYDEGDEGDDYLTATVGVYDKENGHERALSILDSLKNITVFPDILKSAEIDEDSVKYTVVTKDENDPISYDEIELLFTYNGSKYVFTFRDNDFIYDTGFSEVEIVKDAPSPAASYRLGNYTTTLSAADGATTEENVVNTATEMFNSIKNKMKDLFVQFENEEGVPTFPEGAVIDKDIIFYMLGYMNAPSYQLYFTYNGNRYIIQLLKCFPEQSEISIGKSDGYRTAGWCIGPWSVMMSSTDSNVTEEEITEIATALYNSVAVDGAL